MADLNATLISTINKCYFRSIMDFKTTAAVRVAVQIGRNDSKREGICN